MIHFTKLIIKIYLVSRTIVFNKRIKIAHNVSKLLNNISVSNLQSVKQNSLLNETKEHINKDTSDKVECWQLPRPTGDVAAIKLSVC